LKLNLSVDVITWDNWAWVNEPLRVTLIHLFCGWQEHLEQWFMEDGELIKLEVLFVNVMRQDCSNLIY